MLKVGLTGFIEGLDRSVTERKSGLIPRLAVGAPKWPRCHWLGWEFRGVSKVKTRTQVLGLVHGKENLTRLELSKRAQASLLPENYTQTSCSSRQHTQGCVHTHTHTYTIPRHPTHWSHSCLHMYHVCQHRVCTATHSTDTLNSFSMNRIPDPPCYLSFCLNSLFTVGCPPPGWLQGTAPESSIHTDCSMAGATGIKLRYVVCHRINLLQLLERACVSFIVMCSSPGWCGNLGDHLYVIL